MGDGRWQRALRVLQRAQFREQGFEIQAVPLADERERLGATAAAVESMAGKDFEGARRYYQERTKPIALGIRRGEVTSYISVDPLAD